MLYILLFNYFVVGQMIHNHNPEFHSGLFNLNPIGVLNKRKRKPERIEY